MIVVVLVIVGIILNGLVMFVHNSGLKDGINCKDVD